MRMRASASSARALTWQRSPKHGEWCPRYSTTGRSPGRSLPTAPRSLLSSLEFRVLVNRVEADLDTNGGEGGELQDNVALNDFVRPAIVGSGVEVNPSLVRSMIAYCWIEGVAK